MPVAYAPESGFSSSDVPMDPYEPLDDVSPTPEQEDARRALWRRADRLARDTFPGTPLDLPPPPAPRRRPSRPASHHAASTEARRVVTPPVRRLERRRGRRVVRLALLGIVLLAASVATCSVGVAPATMMSEYEDPIPASPEIAMDVFARGASVLQDVPGSSVVEVTLSEAEATSAMGLGLSASDLLEVMRSVRPGELEGSESLGEIRRRLRTRLLAAEAAAPSTWTERVRSAIDPRLGVEDAQVRFSESGRVVFAGSIRAWDWSQPTLLSLTPRVEDGALRIELHRAQLGRLAAPRFLFDRIERMLSPERILGGTVVEVTALEITGDSLTFEGRIGR